MWKLVMMKWVQGAGVSHVIWALASQKSLEKFKKVQKVASDESLTVAN